MGLKRNLKNFISFSPVESIQKNNKKEMIKDINPKTVSDITISNAVILVILLENDNNNHSDKPFWLKSGKLRFSFCIILVSR